MTALIWVCSFIVITFINALIGELIGFKAGVLIVYLVWFWLAKKWVSSYKQRRYENTFEFISQYTPDEIKEECEKLRCNKEALKTYLQSCVNKKDISKSYSRILYKEFKKEKKLIEVTEESTGVPNINHVLYCRKCGNKLLERAKFCHKCGTKVSNYSTQTQQNNR